MNFSFCLIFSYLQNFSFQKKKKLYKREENYIFSEEIEKEKIEVIFFYKVRKRVIQSMISPIPPCMKKNVQ